MSRQHVWKHLQPLMPQLQSQTHLRLGKVIQAWMSDDFQLEPLLAETDALWAHVTEFLDKDHEAQTPQAQQAYAGIRQALLLHARACQLLDESLRTDNLEAAPQILRLLSEGDARLDEVQGQIGQVKSEFTV